MEKLPQQPPPSRALSAYSQDALGTKAKLSSNSLAYGSDRRIVSKKSQGNDFVFVNHAYVGSMSGLNDTRIAIEPPTSVVREQYWACAKWPTGQRILAIAVGLLLGTVIGLAVTVALTKGDHNIIPDIFRSRPAPD